MPAWYEDFAAPRPVIRTCHEPAHRAVGAVQADGPFSAAILTIPDFFSWLKSRRSALSRGAGGWL